MRATNEDFQAEVFRRSRVYQKKRQTRMKQLTAGMLTLCCVFGGFAFWKMQGPNKAFNMMESGTVAGDNAANDAMDMAPEDSSEALGAVPAAENAEEADGMIHNGNRKNNDPTLGWEQDDSAEESFGGDMASELVLTLPQAIYSADTAELRVTVANPNGNAVTIEPDDFRFEITDDEGNGIAYLYANADESSAVAMAWNVQGSASIEIPLTLSQWGLTSPLAAGDYLLTLNDMPCEPVVFTIEAN